MGVKIYKDGAFQDIGNLRKNTDGAWTDCEAAYKYENGAWHEVWSSMGELTLVTASNLSGNSLTAQGNNLTLYARPRIYGEETHYISSDTAANIPQYDYDVYASITGEWTNPAFTASATMTSGQYSTTGARYHKFAYMRLRYYKNSKYLGTTTLLNGGATANSAKECLEKEVSVTYEKEVDEIRLMLSFVSDRCGAYGFVTATLENIMVDGKKYGANASITVS